MIRLLSRARPSERSKHREERPDERRQRRGAAPQWFERRDLDGFLHRSWLKSSGVTDETFRGRPLIGICNSWSELVNCNVHLRGLAESVKRGVLQAGGFPLEFPVLSLGESLMKPTTMLYRNLMAMDVEESIRAYPLDGVVAAHRVRQDEPGEHHGRRERGHPVDRRHRRADAERALARSRDRLLQRLLALPRGAARRAHHRGRVGRDRERDVAVERSLHDDGHRLDDGVRDGGARA